MEPPTLTILSSVDPLVREGVLAAVHHDAPSVITVQHELTTLTLDGSVHRLVRDGRTTDTPRPVDERCCLSCLLRDDTIATLDSLAGRDVLLVLPPSVEPAAVAAGLAEADVADLRSLVTAVDAADLERRLTTSEALQRPASHDDDPRSAAEVLGRQLEHADLVLHTAGSDRELALLEALAPAATRHAIPTPTSTWLGGRRHDPRRFHDDLRAGVPRPPGDPVGLAGVHRVVWHRRRPLHPGRLLDAIEQDALFAEVVRASGSIWVATRPGTVLELEVAGADVQLAAVDAWLAAFDGPAGRPTTSRELGGSRAAVAAARWDPRFGDRAQDLALVCADRDPAEVMAHLDACLLDGDEVALGAEVWRTWPDPFAAWLEPEDELLASASAPTHDGPAPDGPDPSTTC
jgi:G3E family GTPase